MKPIGERIELIFGNDTTIGFDRTGDDYVPPRSPEQIEAMIKAMLTRVPGVTDISQLPEEQQKRLIVYAGNAPFIEGAWLDKYNNTYYMQYATPGTQYNTYADGVYISKSPLGPYMLAKNNPFSYKPGGFITGAGNGSTLCDKENRWWHTSTMRISITHDFERRVGLWQAGFDADNDLFCDQRFGDWVTSIDRKPCEKPEWMLLSYGKKVSVSSGTGAENVTDENIRTWWKADGNTNEKVILDLGNVYDVRAVQINFADDNLTVELPEDSEFFGETDKRIIDCSNHFTRWLLEGSIDGNSYFDIKNKAETDTDTDLPHDLIVIENGLQARYLRLTVYELPFLQNICVSGLRVFGKAEGNAPAPVKNVIAERKGDLDIFVQWEADDVVGHNILWGYAPEKLYHSYMVFGKNSQNIGALIKGEPVFVRVDSFNECGITDGIVFPV